MQAVCRPLAIRTAVAVGCGDVFVQVERLWVPGLSEGDHVVPVEVVAPHRVGLVEDEVLGVHGLGGTALSWVRHGYQVSMRRPARLRFDQS